MHIGEHDGAEAICKQQLRKEQLMLDVVPIRNAYDVVVFLRHVFNKEFAGPSDMRQNVTRFFWEIKVSDIDKTIAYGCMTVQGSRMIHSISSLSHMDSELLLVQHLTCFCPTCINSGEVDDCDEIQHVEPWNTIRLVPMECIVARGLISG